MTQVEPKYRPDRWSLGVDPGFKGTGLVLMADGVPVAAALATDLAPKPVQHRMHRMGLWFYETIQEWVYAFQIDTLHVVMELAFMRKGNFRVTDQSKKSTVPGRNVKTMATQMRMIGVYEDKLYDIGGCQVWLGSVTNSESKAQFTGHGNADKSIVIAFSAWAKRVDLDEFRDHLADAQAHGTCYPVMTPIVYGVEALNSRYTDGAVGSGTAWTKRHRKAK